MAIMDVKSVVHKIPKHEQVQRADGTTAPQVEDGVFQITERNGFLPLSPALRRLPPGR